ncbi:MAG: type 4a pilus biogenesis protein PilO [Candidatus Chisholmbacteria bacterium]|nr:type 4a pilus biogenesis protein PilO [Candidatus Chisholmbacteria bacterium]
MSQTPQPSPPTPKIHFGALVTPIAAVALIGINLVTGLLLTNTASQGQVETSHLEALKRNRQNSQSLEQNLQTYSGKITQLNEALPKEADIPDFIESVTTTAETEEVTATLNFTSNVPSANKDKLWFIPLSLAITGANDNLMNFLQKIKRGSFQIRFEHLEVEAPAGLESSLVTARISGVLFVAADFAKGGE